MMKTGLHLDLNAQLVNWILARRSDQMTRRADRLFRELCADPTLEEYIVSLPLGGLPEIQRALWARASEPGPTVLEEAVRTAMRRDWRQLTAATINRAANTYVCCLGRVLLNSVTLSPAREPVVQAAALAHQIVGSQR